MKMVMTMFIRMFMHAPTSGTAPSLPTPYLLAADAGELPRLRNQDEALLGLLDQVHLATGGHAGDTATCRDLAARAKNYDCTVVLHPGLPDPEHFGRVWYDIAWPELEKSLDQQRAVLSHINHLKFHGALYNRAQTDANLAAQLTGWMQKNSIATVTTLPHGALADAARAAGMTVQAEGFLDRGYDSHGHLLPRQHPRAMLPEARTWLERLQHFRATGTIMSTARPNAEPSQTSEPAQISQPAQIASPVDVWTVHGDSDNVYDNLHWLRSALG
jgi:UPF0271 protein